MQQNFGKFADVVNALLPWAIVLVVTVAIMAIGVYLLGKWRGHGDEDRFGASEALTKFHEMHARGEVSDEEFRDIKSQLASQMQAELSDSNKTG